MKDERPFADAVLTQRAEQIAAELLRRSTSLETAADRRRRARIGATVADPASRLFLMELTDQVLRIADPDRAARRLRDLIIEHGIPSFATGADRLGLVAARTLSPVAPRLVTRAVTERLRREFSTVVLPLDPGALARHVQMRRRQGIDLNVNLLGEAILGGGEAAARLTLIMELLERPEITYLSVKISAICDRLDVVAFEDSVTRICERLRRIYRTAQRTSPAKFVNLDMEEYRDLGLTVEAFLRVLAEPEFAALDAGIVLQAYLPDSHHAFDRIATFARQRFASHGGRIKVRLVKGANLAMERVEAELRGWPQAPLTTKEAVDASYKRLLDRAVEARNHEALRVGVASHNLFDIGWALALREQTGAPIELEMLEGMANPQALATAQLAGGLLLYAPVVARRDFGSAVAYLVRRFDENTSPDNFLSQLFALEVGSATWDAERRRFETAVAERLAPPPASRRAAEDPAAPPGAGGTVPGRFSNVADADFTLERVGACLVEELGRVRALAPTVVCAMVDGREVGAPLTGVGEDPSAPGQPFYRYVEVESATIDEAVAAARLAVGRWQALGAPGRRAVLERVASLMARERLRAVATMAYDAAKTAGEADPEVSEAIDYARYYAEQAVALDAEAHSVLEPLGVVAVVPPWNFPYAIPAGGVFAALAAGNAVLLKPAPESVLTASLLAEQCWQAGVPKDVLQFLPCADGETGRHLVTHQGVDCVIFTGAFDTARRFLQWRPTMRLQGETSGKNAVVITAAADLDDAIRDLVRSAFGHAGQKCSAASLAIVEAPLYDNGRFLARLADAVSSLRVGAAADAATDVGPLIRPPSGPLRRALCELGPGERWLVTPRVDPRNERLWSPGVKIGVRPGSEFHLTECFGPVLGVMRARDLDHALELQNATPYGLTAGLQSLDPREIATWCARVAAGNLYVNRVTTGAVVRRQPFGGWKRSAIGSFVKPGGPHYLSSLLRMTASTHHSPEDELKSALRAWERLSVGEDPSELAPELNLFRLRALENVSLRIGSSAEVTGLGLALEIARQLGVSAEVSTAVARSGLPGDAPVESDEVYVARVVARGVSRARLCAVDPAVRLALVDAGVEVDVADLSPIGPLELLHWCREQCVSMTLHRHGNVQTNRSVV